MSSHYAGVDPELTEGGVRSISSHCAGVDPELKEGEGSDP